MNRVLAQGRAAWRTSGIVDPDCRLTLVAHSLSASAVLCQNSGMLWHRAAGQLTQGVESKLNQHWFNILCLLGWDAALCHVAVFIRVTSPRVLLSNCRWEWHQWINSRALSLLTTQLYLHHVRKRGSGGSSASRWMSENALFYTTLAQCFTETKTLL